jgi:hypothetical protein
MAYVVIPLSATRRAPFVWASLISGPVGHLVFVGLPISLAVRRFRYTEQELPAQARHQIA